MERTAEVHHFLKYLFPSLRQPPAWLVEDYWRACRKFEMSEELSSRDPILRLALGSSFWLGCLDAGCALASPRHPLRRKLFILTALVEMIPDASCLFLPRQYGVLGHMWVMWSGGMAVLKAFFGIPLVLLMLRSASRSET